MELEIGDVLKEDHDDQRHSEAEDSVRSPKSSLTQNIKQKNEKLDEKSLFKAKNSEDYPVDKSNDDFPLDNSENFFIDIDKK